jgi:hypothetical protein
MFGSLQRRIKFRVGDEEREEGEKVRGVEEGEERWEGVWEWEDGVRRREWSEEEGQSRENHL